VKVNPTTQIVWHFTVHICTGVVLFLIVTGAAVFLWWVTELMAQHHVPTTIQVVCYWLSELVFGLDVLAFGLYAIVVTWRLVKDICKLAWEPGETHENATN
jgi:hypothetical protein